MRTNHIRMISIAAATGIAVLLTGCAKNVGNNEAQPIQENPQTQINQIKPEDITESPSAVETAKITGQTSAPQTEEKMKSPKDILVKVPKSDRSGTVQAVISIGDSEDTVVASFQSNQKAIGIQDSEGNTIYSDENVSGYYSNKKWTKIDSSFKNLWNGIYKSQFEKIATIDEKERYKYTIEYEDTLTPIAGMLCYDEISDFITGSTEISYYIDPDTFQIVRMDAVTDFQGTKTTRLEDASVQEEFDSGFEPGSESESETEPAEISENVMGSVTVIYLPSSTDSVTLKTPVIKDEKPTESKQEKTKNTYNPGAISADKNLYMNSQFDLQVAGKDLFSIDTVKTTELNQKYADQGKGYTEECYGSGTGILLNIISFKSEKEADSALADYVTENSGEDIVSEEDVTIGETIYKTAKATINGAPIKSYAGKKNGRILIMTIFYQAENTVSDFEKQIYSMKDDPFWKQDSWTMSGYTVTTPDGYSIQYDKSSDFFTEFSSKDSDINIFLFNGTSIDSKISEETTADDKSVKETITSEPITLQDGSQMTYLQIKNTDKDYVYYTYIGLRQIDADLMEYYIVSTSADEDYRSLFETISENIQIPAKQEETASVQE